MENHGKSWNLVLKMCGNPNYFVAIFKQYYGNRTKVLMRNFAGSLGITYRLAFDMVAEGINTVRYVNWRNYYNC